MNKYLPQPTNIPPPPPKTKEGLEWKKFAMGILDEWEESEQKQKKKSIVMMICLFVEIVCFLLSIFYI